jgi:hypothetical protein
MNPVVAKKVEELVGEEEKCSRVKKSERKGFVSFRLLVDKDGVQVHGSVEYRMTLERCFIILSLLHFFILCSFLGFMEFDMSTCKFNRHKRKYTLFCIKTNTKTGTMKPVTLTLGSRSGSIAT